MKKKVLYGTLLTDAEAKVFQSGPVGIMMDDQHPCNIRLIAVMPDRRVFDLGGVKSHESVPAGKNGPASYTYHLHAGTCVVGTATVKDFLNYAVKSEGGT